MSVTEDVCPNCGAPLTLTGGRCAFCHVPLQVSSVADVAIGDSPQGSDPDGPFAMKVEDVFSIRGRGTVVTGRIAQGSLHVGAAVVIDGAGGVRQTTCTGIEMFRKSTEVAVTGNNVGLMLRDVTKDHVASGDWLRAAS